MDGRPITASHVERCFLQDSVDEVVLSEFPYVCTLRHPRQEFRRKMMTLFGHFNVDGW